MIRKKFSNIGVVNISQCGSILSPFRSILRPQLLFVAELNCIEYVFQVELRILFYTPQYRDY